MFSNVFPDDTTLRKTQIIKTFHVKFHSHSIHVYIHIYIFTNIIPQNYPTVGNHTIHGDGMGVEGKGNGETNISWTNSCAGSILSGIAGYVGMFLEPQVLVPILKLMGPWETNQFKKLLQSWGVNTQKFNIAGHLTFLLGRSLCRGELLNFGVAYVYVSIMHPC